MVSRVLMPSTIPLLNNYSVIFIMFLLWFIVCYVFLLLFLKLLLLYVFLFMFFYNYPLCELYLLLWMYIMDKYFVFYVFL